MTTSELTRSAPAGVGRRRSVRRRLREFFGSVTGYCVLTVLSLGIVLPLSWMLTVALTPDHTPVFSIPIKWWPTDHWEWDNFVKVLTDPDNPLLQYVGNTVMIVVVTSLGTLFCSAPAAYALARLDFRGKEFMFAIVVITMLIPWQALLIPQFVMFYKIGWFGSFLPLLVPSFFGSPSNAFFIFLMRQYMRTFPKELDEAVRMDGGGPWRTFWSVILPLSRPVLYVALVFNFLTIWNDLLGPLIYLTNQDQYTIALGMANLTGRGNVGLNSLMAANLIMMLPPLVLYFFVQKRLIGGIASVGIR